MTAIIRPVEIRDNAAVAGIIRSVMPEFGAAGKGFAIHDPEVDHIYETYSLPRSAYFVCEADGKVLGGAGVAPLEGGDEDTCELRKMYILPEGRGKGLGQQLLSRALVAAREIGFEYCYLETFNTMKDAMRLYEKNAFGRIAGPQGNTGHFACDTFYKLRL